MSRLLLLAGACLGMVGCAYHARLTATPGAALVVLPSGEQVATPAEVTLRVSPFNSQIVQVSSPGYRTLTVDLRDREVRPRHYLRPKMVSPDGARTRGEVHFVLVPVHGPAGTWNETEVPEP